MHNKLMLNVLGGGNFGSSKLTSNHRILIKGRIAAWIQALVFVFFVFSLSACSSDENTENEQKIDYKSQFSAHEWEISSAEQYLGSFLVDVKETPTYCRFTNDSIYFSEKELVYHFDADGKITKSGYEISPCGSYPYTILEDKIKIENQIFTITRTGDSYVFENGGWRLVLINK